MQNIQSNYFPGGGGNDQLLGSGRSDKYVNPFYNVPLQYLPMNIDHMMWWADHFLIRFGFYRTAINRIANYFITELNIECDDEEAKRKYREILESLHWKETLGMTGLNLIAYGNLYATINQGFERYLICPKCKKVYNIDRLHDYKFGAKGVYKMRCQNPNCGHNGAMRAVDKPTRSPEKINVIFWNPREIKLRHEDTTGDTEYYWDYPQAYAKKVTKTNNVFYSKKTPKVIFDSIYQKRMLQFNRSNFVHLKLPSPAGIKTDGRAVPPAMFMFDDFFMLQVLRRFNEAICYEDINPFRVFSMGSGENSQANPILHQNSGAWQSSIDAMIGEHRRDPGAYHKFPFPLQYQQLGGDGKQLAPVELINVFTQNILNAMNIPQELYTMNLQTQAVGPSLRLFENSWSVIPDNYNKLLETWADVIGKVRGLPPAKISLIPITLSDDVEKKSIISQLVSANTVAKSEMLNLYGLDFKEQLRKKIDEEKAVREIQEEEAKKQQLSSMQEASLQGGGGGGATPGDVLSKAQDIAQQLFPQGGAERREVLQQIKAQDETLWSAVKGQLDQMTGDAKAQGLAQAKQ